MCCFCHQRMSIFSPIRPPSGLRWTPFILKSRAFVLISTILLLISRTEQNSVLPISAGHPQKICQHLSVDIKLLSQSLPCLPFIETCSVAVLGVSSRETLNDESNKNSSSSPFTVVLELRIHSRFNWSTWEFFCPSLFLSNGFYVNARMFRRRLVALGSTDSSLIEHEPLHKWERKHYRHVGEFQLSLTLPINMWLMAISFRLCVFHQQKVSSQSRVSLTLVEMEFQYSILRPEINGTRKITLRCITRHASAMMDVFASAKWRLYNMRSTSECPHRAWE